MTNLMRVTVLGAVTTAAMLVVVHPAREGMSGVGVTATGAGMPHVGAIMDRGKVLTVADTPLMATDLSTGMAMAIPAAITTAMAVQVLATGMAHRS